MTTDARHITIAVVIALMLLLAGCAVGYLLHPKCQPVTNCNQLPPSDTTWFTITETKTVTSPPDVIVKIKDKIVYVPLTVVEMDTTADSAKVTIPFEQHFAQLDDVADVWYSGFQAQIDSAVVYKRTVTEIIRQPYEVKPPPNLVMVQAGITDASLTYMHRLGRSVWLGASAGSTYTGIPSARVSVGFQF